MRKTKRVALIGAALAATCAALAPGQAMAASETCTDPAAPGVDGYILNNYQRLVTQRDPANPKTTWICYRAYAPQAGGVDRGGRIDVRDATVSPTLPSADNQGAACTTTVPNAFPGPRPIFGGGVGDPGDPNYTPFLIDGYLGAGQVWGCLQAGAISARVKVATTGIGAPAVTLNADSPGTPLPVQKQGPLGYPSNKCLEGYWHVRDVNMRVQDTHVWAYHWPESPTQQAICLRVERKGMQPIGYRLVLDTTNVPGVTPVVGTSEDAARCTKTVAEIVQPVQVRLSRSEGPEPRTICLQAAGVTRTFTAGVAGTATPPKVHVYKDPDSV